MANLIGITQLAEQINLSTSCIYQWVSQRKIPHLKMGRKLLFDPEKIDEWVAEKEVPKRSLD